MCQGQEEDGAEGGETQVICESKTKLMRKISVIKSSCNFSHINYVIYLAAVLIVIKIVIEIS